MQKLYKQPLLIIGTIIVLLVGLILAVILSQRATINRSHAIAATTLAFSPSSSTATVGTPLTMSISLNPGTNEVSSIKFDILYDASVFSAGASPLTIDPSLFPSPAVGGTPIPNPPVITVNGNQGEIQETISVGSNPNAVITSPVIIGTLTLNTNPNTTTTNSQITWGTNTAVYSIGPSDLANENVLASAQSETVTVSGVNLPTSTPTPTVTPVILPTSTPTMTPIPPTNTPTLTPTITPLPSNTPTPTSAPSPTPTITPTAVPTDNIFNMNVFLDGIGQAGDLVNRNGGGNPNPHHTTRTAMIELDDANAMPVSTATGSVNYNGASGNFVNQQFDFGSSVVAGNYLVKVKVLGYLWKRIPGFLSLTPGQTVTLPATYLVTGDINNDNSIDLLDYNTLLSCFNALGPAQGTCTAADQTAADLNDDGTVDLIDYNLWLRDHSVVKGD